MTNKIILHMYVDESGRKLEFFPYQRTMYNAFISKFQPGDAVEITLQKQGRKKTNPQLAYWHGVLMPFARNALRDAGHNTLFDVSVGELTTGVKTTLETTDLLFKTLFKGHTGARQILLKREMTTATMSELIDFTLRWLAENLGAFAPTPEEK